MTNETAHPARGAALISGGGRRIGAAIARTLTRAGYAVVLHAHRLCDEAKALAAEIVQAGGQARVVLGDLADAEAVQGLVPAAAAFGPLTLLVNNAGEFDEIATLTQSGFARAIAVNLAAFAPAAGVGRAGAARRLDRQRARPARAQADAALSFLYAEQERALHRHRDAGPGARTPDDTAAAVLYLAEAHSVTGVTLPVDGGQHLEWRTAGSDIAE